MDMTSDEAQLQPGPEELWSGNHPSVSVPPLGKVAERSPYSHPRLQVTLGMGFTHSQGFLLLKEKVAPLAQGQALKEATGAGC